MCDQGRRPRSSLIRLVPRVAFQDLPRALLGGRDKDTKDGGWMVSGWMRLGRIPKSLYPKG